LVASPSHVADRTNRLARPIPFIEVRSNIVGMAILLLV
jgi:hypothetical protein